MMNQSDSSGSVAKKRNNENNHHANSAAVAVNQERSANILKLDIDCYEEAFDYFPLGDLISVGRTCKRLQQVAGHCYQQNYSDMPIFASEDGVEIFDFFEVLNQIDVNHFAPFIQKICFHKPNFRTFFELKSKFCRLKEILICDFKLTDMISLKEIPIENLEVLCISGCELSYDFYEIIGRCTKLKRLEILNCKGKFSWLGQKYPALEHFKFDTQKKLNERIPAFLELNPNIRTFATNLTFFWENRNKMMSANIKLDDLGIRIDTINNGNLEKSTSGLLNELYDRGFYRKLQLEIPYGINQEQMNRLGSLNALNKLFYPNSCGPDRITFPKLNNLEELYVDDSEHVVNFKMMVNVCINLKRIHFLLAGMDDIMPFIKRSADMQAIKVEVLGSVDNFNANIGIIIDLLALNKERSKLPDARKITLYVEERHYLATKWAIKEIDLEYIRLRRKQSFDWHHNFRLNFSGFS